LGESYRKIKDTLIEKPELASVFNTEKDVSTITMIERNYIQQVIIQMYSVYIATKLGQFDFFEGIENDIRRYLSFPLSNQVWEEVKMFQDREFVAYIDEILHR